MKRQLIAIGNLTNVWYVVGINYALFLFAILSLFASFGALVFLLHSVSQPLYLNIVIMGPDEQMLTKNALIFKAITDVMQPESTEYTYLELVVCSPHEGCLVVVHWHYLLTTISPLNSGERALIIPFSKWEHIICITTIMLSSIFIFFSIWAWYLPQLLSSREPKEKVATASWLPNAFFKQESECNFGLTLFQTYEIRAGADPELMSEFCFDPLAQIIEIADTSPDISLSSHWLKVSKRSSEINTAKQACSGGECVRVHVCEPEERKSHGDVSRAAAGVLL